MKAYVIMLIPLLLIVFGGILNGASADFNNNTGNGFANNWQGCVSTCTVGNVFTQTLFSSSIFAPLIKGDFFGFVFSFFSVGNQSNVSLITLVIGAVLVALGSGVSIQAFGTGFTITDSATRMYQSLGIDLLLYALIGAVFGAWISNIAPDWGIGVLLNTVFISVTMFGAYLNGRGIADF